MKWADLRAMFKKASICACTSAFVVSPDPVSHTPPTSSAIKTPNNTKTGP
jgi:hypothetical protein